MSFVGAVGSLMKGSGLNRLLESAFVGAEKMLIGKKFQMNVRALRMTALELLRGFVEQYDSNADLDEWFETLCTKSKLAQHWIQNLIKPFFVVICTCKTRGRVRIAFICL